MLQMLHSLTQGSTHTVLTQARCTSPLWLSWRHISQSELATSSSTAKRMPFSKLSCSLSDAIQWHNVSTNLHKSHTQKALQQIH